MAYSLTYDRLMLDLWNAYCDACRRKRSKLYVERFNRELDGNLAELLFELWSGTWRPGPSSCFIVKDPKTREVFAARFRDRIVHHLYCNYVRDMFERTYIADCYSCIKGRGTGYGVKRLEKHIRSATDNWSRKAYVLKMDVRNYFTSIDRNVLFNETIALIEKMKSRRAFPDRSWKWRDLVDVDFVERLTETLVFDDPTENAVPVCDVSEWSALAPGKSLFESGPDRGLPIGNLPSQMFSNVFMGVYDDWMKRTVKAKHYGRYVDDFYDVDLDESVLEEVLEASGEFLSKYLRLELNPKKCFITDTNAGIEFIGAFVKPHRTYVAAKALRRIEARAKSLSALVATGKADLEYVESSVNSMLGTLSCFDSYNVRRRLFAECLETEPLRIVGAFDMDVLKYKCFAGFKSLAV